MTKLKSPLFSLDARNSLSRVITFVRRRGQNIAESRPEPDDVRSLAQLSWRHMYQKGVALWHALSAAEKMEWESLARPKHMTGFAWFMSQMLKPNPGLYLPLQGGTMSGDIDMAKNRLLKLPLPSDSQEPLTLAYYLAIIEPQLMNEGARVYHNLAITIPNATWIALGYSFERYDTDSIHHLTVNNSRLTCQTAGKYIIVAQVRWQPHAGGDRRYLRIVLNGATKLSATGSRPSANWQPCNTVTIYDLGVGDYVEAECYQDAGGNLNVEADPNMSPEFMMGRIGV